MPQPGPWHRAFLIRALILVWAALMAESAVARANCESPEDLRPYAPLATVRLDNDLFASRDSGYTSGAQLGLIYPDIDSAQAQRCMPSSIRWLGGKLSWMRSAGFDHELFVRMSQGIFTPEDPARTDLIVDDRPYAGVLTFSAGLNARDARELRSTSLVIGVVGPASMGRQTQEFFHGIVGATEFKGWNNQLRNEVVGMVAHDRYRRMAAGGSGSALQWDAIGRWGGALGTLQTGASAGAEIRLGYRLPEDFGSNPIERASVLRLAASRPASGWSAHVFGSIGTRLVLRDITLDGNTFVDSHSVRTNPLVGEAALGFAITFREWRFAFARAFRTREFDGQVVLPSFGGFMISHPL